MHKDAVISPDEKYRYLLIRRWDRSRPMMTFVLLNPSTADPEQDSTTIDRCISIAKVHKQGGIRVVTLYAYRTDDPSELWRVPDPIGPLNIVYLTAALKHAQGPIVVAWGCEARTPRISSFKQLADDLDATLWCLGKSKDGEPNAPLANIARHELQLWN